MMDMAKFGTSAASGKATGKTAKKTAVGRLKALPKQATVKKRTLAKAGNAGAPAVITSRMSAKSARTHIGPAVDYVRRTGREISVEARGKEVARIAPLGTVQNKQMCEISTTALAKGHRTFTGVILHGPYRVMRDKAPVAEIYARLPGGITAMQGDPPSRPPMPDPQKETLHALEKIREAGLLHDAILRRTELRRRVDQAIQRRLDLLRSSGDLATVAKFEEEYRAIIEKDFKPDDDE